MPKAHSATPHAVRPARARHAAVSAVLFRVLLLNLAVAVAKLVLGYSTGSVSVTSDGYHSLTDSASNIVGLVGLRASRKPPDADHPYGHRKYETLAAGGIFVFLLLAVFEVVRGAVHRLGAPGQTVVTPLSFAVMIATLAINLAVVKYESTQGRILSSELLTADSLHTRSDVFTSLAVIGSLAATRFGYPLLDPIGGLVVAVFIAHTGYEIAHDASQVLADRIMIDEEDIREAVMSVPQVVGCHHIRSRGSYDHVFVDLHVWLPPHMPLSDAHAVSHVVKDRIMERYPRIADAIIHIEPPPPGADGGYDA
ncbi:MAG TPA: cation diffusion facilitator family transporter [Vicinamibacterales bacterium]|nr:cation diffusion facilitator family transporter [Vicinamibacterales bacterium]